MLTIEEKAERYDKGIKVAKSKIRKDNDHVLYEDDIIEIFPELKEDEDELTWLTRYIKEEADCLYFDIRNDEDRAKLKNLQKSLAWLERLSDRNPADGVYPEEGGVRIWKNGHTFLVPKDWNKGKWPLLNGNGYERSKKSSGCLLDKELDVLLDWDFVTATKHIQDLGTDIPLKEGEYMITGAVHLAMYQYRHELNKALRAMGVEEINFDEDCWLAQMDSAYGAWFFSTAYGTIYINDYVVSNTFQVRAVSL